MSVFFCYGLAAAAVVVAAATAVVSGHSAVAAITAAAEDEDEDYDPRTIVTTKVTHLRKPPFLFSSHTMPITGDMLHRMAKKNS